MVISRTLGSLAFAVLLLMAVAPAQAVEPRQEGQPDEPVTKDCRECHWDIYLRWEQSAHGKGLSCGQCHLADQEDHARQGHGAQSGAQACMSCHTTGYDPITDTWEEDNVHCTACHTPVPPTHPDEPMPVTRSEELCGRCHIQARFEWQESRHGQAGVVCISCHSQHRTDLKSSTVSGQCASCHEARTEGYSHSVHFAAGLSCANCHLAPLEGPVGEGNAKRNHTFEVDVMTCVSCHADGLHDATPAEGTTTHISFQSTFSDSTDPMASSMSTKVTSQPAPPEPLGFVAVGGISVGMGIGGVIIGVAMVVIPWASHQYRRLQHRDH